jgi:hypothetical protein
LEREEWDLKDVCQIKELDVTTFKDKDVKKKDNKDLWSRIEI